MNRTVLGVIAAVVLGGGYSAFDYFTGNETGETCIYNDDCKGNLSLFNMVDMGAQCLQDETGFYCTMECGTTADCPAGWTCEIVYITENGIETGQTNNVCARPIPGQMPAALPGQVPAAVPGQVPAAVPGQVPAAVPGQVPVQPVAPVPTQ